MNDRAGYKEEFWIQWRVLAMKETEFLSFFQHLKNYSIPAPYLSNYCIELKIWKVYEHSNQETKIISHYTITYSIFNILSLETSHQV